MRTCLLMAFFLLVPHDSSAAPKDPVRIGLVVGLTGPAALWGKSAEEGARLAVAELSTDGQRIELVIEDSKSDPKSAVTAWKKLVEVDQVDAVIGDVWAFLTNPLIPLADAKKIVLISPTVVDASVEQQSPYFFTLGGQAARARNAIDQFFRSHPGLKTASIIYWDDPWGQSYFKEWKESAATHQVEIFESFGVYDWGYDYRTEVTRIAARRPDILIGPHHMERILRRARELNYNPTVLTTSNILEPVVEKQIPAELAAGVYFSDWLPSEEFLSRYSKRWGQEPIAEAHNSYDSVRAIVEAVKINPEDLHAGIRQVKFQGWAGPLDFTKGMVASSSTARLRVINQDGKISTVR